MHPKNKNFYSIHQKIFLAAAYIIPASIAFIFIARYSCNLPLWDQWEFVPMLEKVYHHQNLSFSELASYHNEHRILFPRLIMVALAWVSNWNTLYEIYFGFLLLVLFSYVIYIQLVELYTTDDNLAENKYVLIIGCLTAMLIVFTLVQNENLVWGWQIQIFLNIATVALGAHFLTRRVVLSSIDIALAVICGIIATYSFANGLFFWPIGLLALIVRRRQSTNFPFQLAGWLLLSAVLAFLYMQGYKKSFHNPTLTTGLHNPVHYILYVLTYLGTPMIQARLFVYMPRSVGGAVGIVLVLILAYALLRMNDFWKRNLIFWHILLLYTLVSGAVTALGRSDFGIGQASASRYVTICNMFWLWIFSIGIYVLMKNKYITTKVLVTLGCLFFIFMVYINKVIFVEETKVYDHKIQARQALLDGNMSAKLLENIVPINLPNHSKTSESEKNNFLRKQKLTFYNQLL